MIRGLWRAPYLAVAMLSMASGVWFGLVRLGWILPLLSPDQLILHGPLMVGGFLGTLIGVERAVGMAKRWAYAAPLLTALGSLLLLVLPPGNSIGAGFITAGSAVVVVVFLVVLYRQPTLFAATMGVGAIAWVVGNAQWVAGAAIYRVVLWWVVFLVLTIAGERLELNRLLRPSFSIRLAFVAAAVALLAGVAIADRSPEVGSRVAGVGLIALSGWLIAFDIARRTVRQPGVTRFMAVCLLSGYVWQGVGGAVAVFTGAASPGPLHDGLLHAIFLGFVVAMIFGHAPIVFPAVLRRPLPYRPVFYVHLAILHVSVAVRLTGDFVDELGRLRAWGGLLNALALLVFVGNSVWSVAAGSSRPAARSSPPDRTSDRIGSS